MYEWLKVLHVLAIISWMAALLYLPRLMVYHVEAPVGSQQSETFKVMERKLLNGIMTPAMIVSWVARALPRLGRFRLQGRLAARQDRAGAADVGHARLSGRPGPRLRQ